LGTSPAEYAAAFIGRQCGGCMMTPHTTVAASLQHFVAPLPSHLVLAGGSSVDVAGPLALLLQRAAQEVAGFR